MFVNLHRRMDDIRQVILHAHVHGIIDRIELDVVRVRVARAVNGIIQGQRPLLILRVPEDKLEQPVLVLSVGFWHHVTSLSHTKWSSQFLSVYYHGLEIFSI